MKVNDQVSTSIAPQRFNHGVSIGGTCIRTATNSAAATMYVVQLIHLHPSSCTSTEY
jgi:hypothetical protein